MAQTAQVNINVNATSANKSVNELVDNINKAGGSTQSLRLELRKVTQELQGLEPGSARFQELSARAGQLRDQIKDTSAVIQSQAGNAVERFGTALGNTIQIGVAGFQALSSAQVLFGSENEEVNKSIQKMTALLNLSQAIQSLGGIGDKLVEIKAGFASLIPVQQATAASTATAAVALEGEAVAATAAAGATEVAAGSVTLLGRAMSALPLVGIIAALGFAVKALVDYASADEEAEKQEQKRIATLKKQREEQEKMVKSIAKESSEYTTLIYQLKSTNKGSERRAELIKQINATYGTTLKNLSDENEFQEQLNQSVSTYITLQYNRFKLQKNQQYIDAQNEKRFQAEQKRNKALQEAQDLVDKGIRKSVDDALSYRQDLRETIAASNKSIKEVDDALAKLGARREQLIGIEDKLTEGGKKYVEVTDKTTKSVKDAEQATKDYESILNQIKSVQEDNKNTEDEIAKKRGETFDKTIDLVELERRKTEEESKKKYEAIKSAIEKELTDEKIKADEKKKLLELQKLNEEAYTQTIKVENEKRATDYEIATFKILQANEKRFKYLKDEELALQSEIRFGDNNTTDTKLSLLNREAQAKIKSIESSLLVSKNSNQMEITEFENLQRERLRLLNEYANREAVEKRQIAETEYSKILDIEKTRIEEQKDLSVEYVKNEAGVIMSARIKIADDTRKELYNLTKEQRDAELQLLEEQISKETDAVKKTALIKRREDLKIVEDTIKLREETEKNLNTTIVNLNDDKNTKILEADTDLNAKLKENTIKTEEDIYNEKVKRIDNYIAYAQEQFSQLSNIILEFSAQQQQIRTQQLEDSIAFDKAQIESQYAEGLISREQFDNAVLQLEQKQQQEQLQIDRKNFRTQKALNLVGATIDGARAVLSAFANTTGGIVVKSVAAALAGVFAATQIALIARQEFKAASGGIVPGDGSGEIDSVPARLAPGEAVINARSTQAFLPLLSAMNEMGGGKSFVPDLPPTNQPQRFAPIFADNTNKEPIRAYVVESDISNAQKRISRIERSTRF